MIILASNSPRRKQLLSFGDLPFQVISINIDEKVFPGERPDKYVLRLSQEKAGAARFSFDQRIADSDIIVSADTSVVLQINTENMDAASVLPEFSHLEDESQSQYIILGKPADEQHAQRILQILRNRTHQVYTGVTAMRVADGLSQSTICITDVPMRDYLDDEISAYIDSGDPFDKAGAYAIQHKGFNPAQQLQGCFANVMGLPVCHLAVLLRIFDYQLSADIADKCLKAFDYDCPISGKILNQEY